MKIVILPLNVNAASDLTNNTIFLSYKSCLFKHQFVNDLSHEIAHIITGSEHHNDDWKSEYNVLGGKKKLFTYEPGTAGFAFNIGNISGIQNILTDYHLLQAYRKFSQKILGTEGSWEVINEGNSNVPGDSISAKDQLIRLYPTPKGAFPVVVLYTPVVTHFRSPQARQLCYDMLFAEARIAVGMARRKISGMPTPDGGSISYDGSDLVQEGEKAKEEILDKAIKLGEPLMIHTW